MGKIRCICAAGLALVLAVGMLAGCAGTAGQGEPKSIKVGVSVYDRYVPSSRS